MLTKKVILRSEKNGRDKDYFKNNEGYCISINVILPKVSKAMNLGTSNDVTSELIKTALI